MFCSRCGNQVADGAAFCSVCGNNLNKTVSEEKINVSAVTPINPAPVAETQPSKKSGTGFKIAVAVMAVVAVIAVAFAALVGTGTISFNKDEGKEVAASEEEKKPAVKEPEIGSISTVPAVSSDKSVKKVMMKFKSIDIPETEGMDYGNVYYAADYTNEAEPKLYFSAIIEYGYEPYLAEYMIFDDQVYVKTSIEDGVVYKMPQDEAFVDAEAYYNMFFGRYDEEALAKEGIKFKYLGQETLEGLGNTYVYEFSADSIETISKLWLSEESGYILKREENGQGAFEVSEIITGDDVEFPVFDFTNVIELQ